MFKFMRWLIGITGKQRTTDLTGTYPVIADLRGANLRGANLSGTAPFGFTEGANQ